MIRVRFIGLLALAVVTGALWAAAPASALTVPTTTTVSCAAPSVTTGTPTTCTVTVASNPPPIGTVTFTSTPSSGSFPGGNTCDLPSPPTGTSGQCQVSFTPSAGGDYSVKAAFGGEPPSLLPSSGSTPLTAVDPTATFLSCATNVLSVNASTDCTATLFDPTGSTPPIGQITFASAPTTGTFRPVPVVCKWSPAGAGGSAACAVSFTPSAPGGYVLSASYSGDSKHSASSGALQMLVTTTPTGGGPGSKPGTGTVTITVGAGTLTIARTGTVSSKHVASIKLTCAGAGSATCSGTLTLTAKQKVKVKAKGKHRGKKHKSKTVTNTIKIGSAHYSLSGGSSKTISVKLSRPGFKLFTKAKHHRLKVTATATGGVTRTVTLSPAKSKKKHHGHKKHKKHKK